MKKLRMTIAYKGTEYVGWQIQPTGLSIQEVIQNALKIVLKKETPIVGAGRTDAGVHALGQVAHFQAENPPELDRLALSLNSLLPADIRIKKIEIVPPEFHAQRSAKRKIYHYHLWLERSDDPILAPFHYHFRQKISLPLLQEALNHFIGEHDFASFANRGSSAKTTVRTIYRLEMVPERGGLRLEFEGNGFLYKMVRNITGTLLQVASRKLEIQKIPLLFDAKSRTFAGMAAPAKGLFLMDVIY